MFTKFCKIMQCNGHYAVQGHSRSPILVPIESSCTTSYQWLILTYSCLAPFRSYGWLLVKFSLERGECLNNALAEVIPCQYRYKWYIAKTGFFGLHFAVESIGISSTTFTYSAPKATEFGEITLRLRLLRRLRPSNVTEFTFAKIWEYSKLDVKVQCISFYS